ncbi:Similar to Cyclin-L1-1; acc. no. Q9AS36 [Pyronema omphalodes CBS 100304]|uniref:Similar to Cyclin-L1-1 acc. no. Q9AS36 n=1 Tax=Pyronema omphalodes (strain CBS 100304) TaxID=1076935 RepID=U4KW73_PYROM|nr:Similar to Cyclin-L1-1; acc. no. Q9AS36 [Pyronema omphalodes CBS 100304]
MVSLLTNPLATPTQLSTSPSFLDGVPSDLEASLLWASCTLIQSAGILLRLPQPTIATATILLQRFYLIRSFLSFPPLQSCHAALYLASKLTEHPIKPKKILAVTTYLTRVASPSPISPPGSPSSSSEEVDPESYYIEPTALHYSIQGLLNTETEILKALSFQTHCSLPYSLVVTYLQALDCLEKPVVKKAMAYLNDALVSNCRVYLTHQPNALAVAAIYLAAREEGKKLPEEWWMVFDADREDLGFLCVAILGVEEEVRRRREEWSGVGGVWLKEEVEREVKRRGGE